MYWKIFFWTFWGICLSCKYSTNNFDNIVSVLEQKYSTEYIDSFKNTPEAGIMKYYSPFRGEYSAFSDEIENVSTIFDSVDIGNAQKAYVILNAWHRRLNQKPENIKQMIQEIVDRNAKAEKCFTKKNNFAIFNYRALNYRDTIAIRLPVEIRGNNIKTTVYYGCPIEDWRDFNKNKDLEITIVRAVCAG